MASPSDLQSEPTQEDHYAGLPRGNKGAHGMSEEQVREHQRRRLYEAMIELAATRGYHSTSVEAISALARVSKRDFYTLFAAGGRHPKEACFLGAYDLVLARHVQRLSRAYGECVDPEQRLCAAFDEFVTAVREEPLAARFALIEAFGAGPAALDRMERARQVFQRMFVSSLAANGQGDMPATVVRGIVGGVERVTRVYLQEGDIDGLAASAAELSGWVATYRAWEPPVGKPLSEAVIRPRIGAKNEGLRILRAATTIAATDGYQTLSASRIVSLAGVSERTFRRYYDGPDAIETCFLAGFDLLGVEALLCAQRAARAHEDWREGVCAGIAALLDRVASHPFLGTLAFIEIFSVGPSAIERRSQLLRRFATLLLDSIPEAERPSQLVGEAVVGGIWSVAHHYVAHNRTRQLSEITHDAAYIALAPAIGHEQATRVVCRHAQACGVPHGD
jgi:AcrR family transcriptional regulator